MSELVLISSTTCMCDAVHGLEEQIQINGQGETNRLKTVLWNTKRSSWPDCNGRAPDQLQKRDHDITQGNRTKRM
jgi:hypothetical protein